MTQPTPLDGIDEQAVRQRYAQRLRVVSRAMKLYGAICGFLILVTFPLTIVAAGVYLLAYNQGHVRPSWAAAVLALFASAITGSLAWLAGLKYDSLAREREGLREGWIGDR